MPTGKAPVATFGIASSDAVDRHIQDLFGKIAQIDRGKIRRCGALELPVEGKGHIGLRAGRGGGQQGRRNERAVQRSVIYVITVLVPLWSGHGDGRHRGVTKTPDSPRDAPPLPANWAVGTKIGQFIGDRSVRASDAPSNFAAQLRMAPCRHSACNRPLFALHPGKLPVFARTAAFTGKPGDPAAIGDCRTPATHLCCTCSVGKDRAADCSGTAWHEGSAPRTLATPAAPLARIPDSRNSPRGNQWEAIIKLSRRAFLATSIAAFATPIIAYAQSDTITIGVLNSLSGTMVISETTLKDTMPMLIEAQKAKGGVLGRQLEAVVVDPASDWPLFAEKARELLTVSDVDVMFGCWTSVSRNSVLAVIPATSEKHLWHPGAPAYLARMAGRGLGD